MISEHFKKKIKPVLSQIFLDFGLMDGMNDCTFNQIQLQNSKKLDFCWIRLFFDYWIGLDFFSSIFNPIIQQFKKSIFLDF
jgi:hypothetical protein